MLSLNIYLKGYLPVDLYPQGFIPGGKIFGFFLMLAWIRGPLSRVREKWF